MKKTILYKGVDVDVVYDIQVGEVGNWQTGPEPDTVDILQVLYRDRDITKLVNLASVYNALSHYDLLPPYEDL